MNKWIKKYAMKAFLFKFKEKDEQETRWVMERNKKKSKKNERIERNKIRKMKWKFLKDFSFFSLLVNPKNIFILVLCIFTLNPF